MGHIIGLGDRHGSNILVDQLTWGALHIDFGDVSPTFRATAHITTSCNECPDHVTDGGNQLFGVAQDRSYLPEKVPFRLTKMMTNCFELADRHLDDMSESKGNYRKSSIVTMGVLRESRDIILAMLEAFLYDPLLSWTVSRPFCRLRFELYKLTSIKANPGPSEVAGGT